MTVEQSSGVTNLHPIIGEDTRVLRLAREHNEIRKAQEKAGARRRTIEEQNRRLRDEHRAAVEAAALAGDPPPPEPNLVEEGTDTARILFDKAQDVLARVKAVLADMVVEGAGSDLAAREMELRRELAGIPPRDPSGWEVRLREYESVRSTAEAMAQEWDAVHPGYRDTESRPRLGSLIRRTPVTAVEVFEAVWSRSSESLIGLDGKLDPAQAPGSRSGDEPAAHRMHPAQARAIALNRLDKTNEI